MEFTDKELVVACRRGDESAWEALINRYQRLIYAIPRRAGLDEDQAGEVFQEVFTTLFQKLNDIDEPDRLQAWLVTTARRKTIRLISTARHDRHGVPSEERDELELSRVPDDAPLADEVMLRLEDQHLTRTALASLDERCKKLLTLLFYEDQQRSYADIAMVLGMPEGSVGPTRARCLEKMLRLLNK